MQEGTTATHKLETKDRHDQQARIATRHHSHSLPREPRTGMINRVRIVARHHSHSLTGEPRTGMISRPEL